MNAIEKVLQPLVGLPLWGSGRVVTLQWFQFGRKTRVVSRLKPHKSKMVGQYALHVQCAWRIVDGARILVASRDRYSPARKHAMADSVSWDWDKQGSNRCDERVRAFLKNSCSLRVVSTQADTYGGFSLGLQKGYALDVFPDDSLGGEQWRLLTPGATIPHWVFSKGRLREE